MKIILVSRNIILKGRISITEQENGQYEIKYYIPGTFPMYTIIQSIPLKYLEALEKNYRPKWGYKRRYKKLKKLMKAIEFKRNSK